MIIEAINKIIKKENLEFNMAKETMEEIMNGQATPSQIAAFITALRMKGETDIEISACAFVMREKSARIEYASDVMDIVGTGGDEVGTINVSTASAIIVAAAGVVVAKHGNRSVSSKCGSADVLEHLGIKIDSPISKTQEILNKIGLCFMFAPMYHGSMKFAAPVRKEIGIRTIFNILGPLSNPAKVNMQIMGVYDELLIQPMAKALMDLGITRGMVIRGNDGLDEATITTTTKICEINNKTLTSYEINPLDYGIKRCEIKDILGGDAKENAKIIKDIYEGTLIGPKRDIIVLNSALALYIADKVKSIKDGVVLANEIIDSKKALKKLNDFIIISNA